MQVVLAMKRFLQRASLAFSAGAFGGVVNGLFVWFCGARGWTHALGIAVAPALKPAFIYPRVAWGGLWGLLFLLPLFVSASQFRRAVVFFVGPVLVQLFVVFPFKAHKGVLGLELGSLTPLLVIAANLVWAEAAALWLVLTGTRVR